MYFNAVKNRGEWEKMHIPENFTANEGFPKISIFVWFIQNSAFSPLSGSIFFANSNSLFKSGRVQPEKHSEEKSWKARQENYLTIYLSRLHQACCKIAVVVDVMNLPGASGLLKREVFYTHFLKFFYEILSPTVFENGAW